MNYKGRIMNSDNDKFYKFLQDHIENITTSPSQSIIDKIKRYSRNNIYIKNKFLNIFYPKFAAASICLSLLIIGFLLFSSYFSINEIYVYEEQLLNVDMQTLFVTKDFLSNEDLAIQHMLLQTF